MPGSLVITRFFRFFACTVLDQSPWFFVTAFRLLFTGALLYIIIFRLFSAVVLFFGLQLYLKKEAHATFSDTNHTLQPFCDIFFIYFTWYIHVFFFSLYAKETCPNPYIRQNQADLCFFS